MNIRRGAPIATLATLFALASAKEARAEGDDIGETLGPLIVGLAAADLGFISYDTYLLARHDVPVSAIGYTEGAIGAPQALGAGAATFLNARERHQDFLRTALASHRERIARVGAAHAARSCRHGASRRDLVSARRYSSAPSPKCRFFPTM